MPETFGGGPTDPEAILNAINDGAVFMAGRIRLRRGGDRWLAVVDTPTGTTWVLTRTRGVMLDGETFTDLERARVAGDGLLMVQTSRMVLVAPEPDAADQVAVLMPA